MASSIVVCSLRFVFVVLSLLHLFLGSCVSISARARVSSLYIMHRNPGAPIGLAMYSVYTPAVDMDPDPERRMSTCKSAVRSCFCGR